MIFIGAFAAPFGGKDYHEIGSQIRKRMGAVRYQRLGLAEKTTAQFCNGQQQIDHGADNADLTDRLTKALAGEVVARRVPVPQPKVEKQRIEAKEAPDQEQDSGGARKVSVGEQEPGGAEPASHPPAPPGPPQQGPAMSMVRVATERLDNMMEMTADLYVGKLRMQELRSRTRRALQHCIESNSRWKDYADHNRKKLMTLHVFEFIRRFLLHVMPPRFNRIRYYGFLSPRNRADALDLCRTLLPEQAESASSENPESPDLPDPEARGKRCLQCKKGFMVTIQSLPPAPRLRAPPSAPEPVDTS